MKIGSFSKTPIERKRYAIDYSDWLGTTESITGATFAATPSTGIPIVVDASTFSGGKILVFFVSFGDTGVTYTLDVRITTDQGQTKEDQLIFKVRSF